MASTHHPEETRSGEYTAVLHPDLLRSIVVRLPQESLETARLVCWHWNQNICSPRFKSEKAKLDEEIGLKAYLCGQWRGNKFRVLDVDTCLSRSFDIPRLPMFMPTVSSVAGGLVFMRIFRLWTQTTVWCVWNPLTGFIKEFSVNPNTYFVVHSTAFTHKVCLYNTTQQMDQDTFADLEAARTEKGNIWNRVDFVFPKVEGQTYVYYKGYLCIINEALNLVVRHIATGSIVMHVLPQNFNFDKDETRLVVYKESLFLLARSARVEEEEEVQQRHFMVWKFEGGFTSESGCSSVPQMPLDIYEHAFPRIDSGEPFSCNVFGDVIFITCCEWVCKGHENGVVLLDMSDLSWKIYNTDRSRQQALKCFWRNPKSIFLSQGDVRIVDKSQQLLEIL